MLAANRFKPFVTSFFVAAAMTLVACGDTSSSPSAYNPSGGGSNSGGSPVATTTQATGGAAKGILKDALVTVSEWDATNKQFIALSLTARTDENGQFNLELPDNDNPLLVTVTTDASTEMICDVAACGEDFGQFITLADYTDLLGNGFTLKAILPSGANTTDFAVTPLTTLAAQWVEKLSGDINLNTNAVNQALSQVADLFGLDASFYATLPVDIANAGGSTGVADMTAGILSAAFYDANSNQTIGESLGGIIGEYINNGGQLPVSSDPAVQNSINALVNRANEIAAIAFNATYGDGSQLDAIVDNLNNLVNRWGEHAQVTSATSSSEFSATEQETFEQAKSLFTQLETYLNLAGIDSTGNFLADDIAKQVQWMYHDEAARNDTSGLIGTVISIALRTAVFSIAAPSLSAQLGSLPNGNCAVELGAANEVPSGIDDICKDSNGNIYLLFTSDITTPNGSVQAVDAKIRLPDLSSINLSSNTLSLDYSLTGTNAPLGTMTNSTIAGELAGDLVVTFGKANTNEPSLVTLLQALAGQPVFDLGEADELLGLLLNTTIDIDVSNVVGKLTRVSESQPSDVVQTGQAFDVALDAVLNINPAALQLTIDSSTGTAIPVLAFNGNEVLLKGTITDGHFIAPREVNGQRHDYLKALTDSFCDYEGAQRSALDVIVANISTAEGCFAARLGGIPELNIAFQGKLGGAIGLVNQVIGGLLGTDALPDMIDGIDMSNLDLSGSAKLLVKDEGEMGYQHYNFTLNRNHITAHWQETGNDIDIYFSGVQGGYLVNDGVWVGTFHIDWSDLALRVALADGTNERFALGTIFSILDPELLMLVIESLAQIELN